MIIIECVYDLEFIDDLEGIYKNSHIKVKLYIFVFKRKSLNLPLKYLKKLTN